MHGCVPKCYLFIYLLPFQLDISVLSVEYIHGERTKKEYAKFMSEKGYRVHRDIRFSNHDIALYVADFIFVKEGT